MHNKIPNHLPARRGSILLFCLGILALLSLLGTALVFIVRKDREAAQSYVENTRATFAAESGVEAAIAKITNFPSSLVALPIFLEYKPGDDRHTLERLKQSSFGVIDVDGDGNQETAGLLSETWTSNGETYRLRINCAQNRINLNDSNSPINYDSDPYEDQLTPEFIHKAQTQNLPPNGKDPDWIYAGDEEYDSAFGMASLPYPNPDLAPGRLTLILQELLYLLFGDAGQQKSWKGDRDWAKSAGQSLFLARQKLPSARFETMSDVKRALVRPGVLSDSQFQILSPYLTLYSWQDPNVLRPTFKWRVSRPPQDPEFYVGNIMPAKGLWGGAEYPKLYSFEDLSATGEPRYSKDIYLFSDMQTSHFELESRSPINLNQASKILLQALISPIRGWYLKEAPDSSEGPRAEDWSQPADPGLSTWAYWWRAYAYHPWYLGRQIMPDDSGRWSWVEYLPDRCQFYFRDEQQKYAPYLFHEKAERDYRLRPGGKNFRFGELCQTGNGGVDMRVIAPYLADSLYNRIHPDFDRDGSTDAYFPFVTWEEFEDHIRSCADPDSGISIPGFDGYMADAVIANFNPNSRLNDFNPNKTTFLHVDKSQLISNTAEFCFHPMGVFEIACMGLVNDARGKRSSVTKVRSVLHAYEALRISSQSQFLSSYTPATGRRCKEYFGESDGQMPTFGAEFDAEGNCPTDNYRGSTVQSYPEPECDRVNFIEDSQYDGSIMLATVKPERGALFGDGDLTNRFHAEFMYGLDAGFAEGGPALARQSEGDQCWVLGHQRYAFQKEDDAGYHVPADRPGLRPLAKSLQDYGNLSGSLFPDGAFSDVGRSLAFPAKLFGDQGKLRSESSEDGGPAGLLEPGADEIRLLYPTGGETLSFGETLNVRWKSGAAGNVEMLLQPGNISVSKSTANDGFLDWKIPSNLESGKNYRLEIQSIKDKNIFAKSGSFLVLSQPLVTKVELKNPVGGEEWKRRDREDILWDSDGKDAGTVRLELLRDGKPQRIIVEDTENDGKYSWRIPWNLPLGEGYQVRVLFRSGGSVDDLNEKPFRVGDESVELGSAGGRRGSLQFWVKPGFNVAHSNRVRQFFGATPFDDKEMTDLWDDFSLYYFSHGGSAVDDMATDQPPLYEPEQGGSWISTRSLFLQSRLSTPNFQHKYRGVFWGLQHPLTARAHASYSSGTVNWDWREEDQSRKPFNLATRQWNHIAFSWDFIGKLELSPQPKLPDDTFQLCVNGFSVPEEMDRVPKWQDSIWFPRIEKANPLSVLDWTPDYFSSVYFLDPEKPTPPIFWCDLNGIGESPNYFRFGESSSAPARNFPADSTFDEIASSSRFYGADILTLEYGYGRYYGDSDDAQAVFTSGEIDPFLLLNTQAKRMSLMEVSWTLYWPKDAAAEREKRSDHPRWNDNRSSTNGGRYETVKAFARSSLAKTLYPPDPMHPDEVLMSIDIQDSSKGGWYYGGALRRMTPDMPSFPGGSQDPVWAANPLLWSADNHDKLRFRLYFNIESGQTLYASPVFDDITFIFRCSQTRVVSWDANYED